MAFEQITSRVTFPVLGAIEPPPATSAGKLSPSGCFAILQILFNNKIEKVILHLASFGQHSNNGYSVSKDASHSWNFPPLN